MNKLLPEKTVHNQTILPTTFDESYETTEDEIREYAVYIGINPEKVKE
jgi:hypothetical protein